MEKQWEEFTQKSFAKGDAMRISLNANGNFGLNQKAVETLGSPEKIVLMFDKANYLIGLKASSPEVEHAYELKRHGTSQSYVLRARSFCSFYGINFGDTVSFNEPQFEDGMIVLQLGNVSEAARRPKLLRFPDDEQGSAGPIQPPKFSTLIRMKMPVSD